MNGLSTRGEKEQQTYRLAIQVVRNDERGHDKCSLALKVSTVTILLRPKDCKEYASDDDGDGTVMSSHHITPSQAHDKPRSLSTVPRKLYFVLVGD